MCRISAPGVSFADFKKIFRIINGFTLKKRDFLPLYRSASEIIIMEVLDMSAVKNIHTMTEVGTNPTKRDLAKEFLMSELGDGKPSKAIIDKAAAPA